MTTSLKLATVEKITAISTHPNADKLEIAQVKNFMCVVQKGQFKNDELIIFIQPDSLLPVSSPWTKPYVSTKNNRVRALKLRGVWSMGIVETFQNVGLDNQVFNQGDNVTDLLKIIKDEPKTVEESSKVRGNLPNNLPKTDEERYQNLDLSLYLGQLIDVTLKIDGQSFSAYCKLTDDKTSVQKQCICGRSIIHSLDDTSSKYIQNAFQYNILDKLTKYCLDNGVSLCLRGEQYGAGIQNLKTNPHCRQPLSLALFSVYLIDQNRYARKNDAFYVRKVAKDLDLPIVPLLQENVALTKELLHKYDEQISSIEGSSQPFEGVVIQGDTFSFKVINKFYDSQK